MSTARRTARGETVERRGEEREEGLKSDDRGKEKGKRECEWGGRERERERERACDKKGLRGEKWQSGQGEHGESGWGGA